MSCGKVLNAQVRSALLHRSETLASSAPDLQHLHRNDRAMVRWFCGAKTHNEVSTDALYAKGDTGGDSGPKHMASEMV